MTFTKADVDRLAKLARIELTDDERDRFSRQLSAILDYVSQIAEKDTSRIAASFAVPDLTNVFREDRVEPFGRERELVDAAPSHRDNLVTVKAVKEE